VCAVCIGFPKDRIGDWLLGDQKSVPAALPLQPAGVSTTRHVMVCSRIVFSCFKWLERLVDRVTGAAGPYFVGLAVILITTGTVCFCKYLFQWYTGRIAEHYLNFFFAAQST
jgi:hypothetical protein